MSWANVNNLFKDLMSVDYNKSKHNMRIQVVMRVEEN